ncbi:MAG: SGNH/GDSL hydrolase family protein [Myxococcales bacterium]
MRRNLVAKIFLATALAVGGACSPDDGAPNGGTGGSASGGTTATGGRSAGATGGEATGGQTTDGTGGISGMPEQSGGQPGSGGAATGGNPSGGNGGSVVTGTGGAGAAGMGGKGGALGTTGGAGGTVAYAPCPMNGSPCKILPLGDSITLGAKSSDGAGYRSPLFKLIVAANQKVTFTGSLASGPTQVSGQPFPRMHEGHSGWTISQLSPLIPSPALNAKPNIILLHIGTNDIGSRNPAAMAMRLDALVEKIAQNGPDALIVVAQITTASSDNDIRDAYNAMIPGMVQSHAAKGQHVISVDVNKIPTSGLSADGVHPNDQGYIYMAGVWYAAIKDLLPK